jgi:hypothetical protein
VAGFPRIFNLERPIVTSTGVRLCLAAAILAAVGCSAERGVSAAAVRDSSGVRIVENREPLAGKESAWRVEPRPALEIGAVEGAPEYQLSGVRGVVRLRDGRVAVANGDTRELRFYDAQGRFVRSAGGPGGGPGEFQSLDGIVAYRGDSLAAWDSGPRRVSVFAPDGSFGRAITLQDVNGATVRLRAAFADGSLLLASAGSIASYLRMGSGEHRDSVTYLRFTAGGTSADTVGRHASREYILIGTDELILPRPVLFGRDSYVGVWRDRVFMGESDRFRVDVVDPRGKLVMSIRRPGEPRPASSDDLARARADAERGRRTQERAARASGALLPPLPKDLPPARSTIPAFDRFVVDSQGNLWLRNYLIGTDDPQRWAVFDTSGQWVTTVETPPSVEIYQIGPDWLLGRGRDELDVEYVRLYPLRRHSGTSAAESPTVSPKKNGADG